MIRAASIMSASITHSIVQKQLTSMGSEFFELGVLHRDEKMTLRHAVRAERIEHLIRWMRRENAGGAHIFIRPRGPHALSLIDDLSAGALTEMNRSGFEPAVVVETSPNNFQAWLNHGELISDHFVSTLAAKELARRFGGDPSSADWRHFGRLAGFTNRKPERQLPNGLAPFVHLRHAESRIYSSAQGFLQEVRALHQKIITERQKDFAIQSNSREDPTRTIHDFHQDSRYGGDLHRADMAWAVYAASRGLSQQEIAQEILNGRDLSKKGSRSRQTKYAARTARKAGVTFQPSR
jgi:hypothetical protein